MDQDPKMQGRATPAQDAQPNNSATAIEDQHSGSVDNEPVARVIIDTIPKSEVPAGYVTVPYEQPKKKHTGLIIALIILIIALLGAAGAAVWYFVYYNNPETVAFDAINGMLHEKYVTASGQLVSDIEGANMQVKLTADAKSSGFTNDSKFTLELMPRDDSGQDVLEEPIKIILNDVVMSDGVIYFQVDNLVETLDRAMREQSVTEEDLTSSMAMAYELAEVIDGEWWRISVPDIIDEIAPNLEEAKPVREFYSCIISSLGSDIKGEIAAVYEKNRFVNVERMNAKDIESFTTDAGNGIYRVTFDYDKMAGFTNALPHTAYANKVYDCYNTYVDDMYAIAQDSVEPDVETELTKPKHISAEDASEATAKDLEKAFPNDADVYLEISDFGHRLNGLHVNAIHGESKVQSDLKFKYEEVTINAPEKYRPVTDLMGDIMAIIREATYPEEEWTDDDDWFYEDDEWSDVQDEPLA